MAPSADEIAQATADKLKPASATPDSVKRKNLNQPLNSAIDLTNQILTPQTGHAKIGGDLNNKYKVPFRNDDGTYELIDVWDLFSSVTSDTRMANLDPDKAEYAFVQWGFDIWMKCLQNGLVGSSACAQAQVLSVTEPSLAKNMAFLRSLHTIRQESSHVQVENVGESRGLFGGLKNKLKGMN